MKIKNGIQRCRDLTPLSVLCDDTSAALTELILDYISVTFCLKISCLTSPCVMRFTQLLRRAETFQASLTLGLCHMGRIKKSTKEIRLSFCFFTGRILHTHTHIYTGLFFKCSSLQKVAENENAAEKTADWIWVGQKTEKLLCRQTSLRQAKKESQQTSLVLFFWETKWFALSKSEEEPSSIEVIQPQFPYSRLVQCPWVSIGIVLYFNKILQGQNNIPWSLQWHQKSFTWWV